METGSVKVLQDESELKMPLLARDSINSSLFKGKRASIETVD
jgi:hypothetical protein